MRFKAEHVKSRTAVDQKVGHLDMNFWNRMIAGINFDDSFWLIVDFGVQVFHEINLSPFTPFASWKDTSVVAAHVNGLAILADALNLKFTDFYRDNVKLVFLKLIFLHFQPVCISQSFIRTIGHVQWLVCFVFFQHYLFSTLDLCELINDLLIVKIQILACYAVENIRRKLCKHEFIKRDWHMNHTPVNRVVNYHFS